MARALKFGCELGIDNAILEGYSEILMKALNEDKSSLSSYGLLIADVKFCHVGFN